MTQTQQPEALNLEEFRAKVTSAAREPLLARIAELTHPAEGVPAQAGLVGYVALAALTSRTHADDYAKCFATEAALLENYPAAKAIAVFDHAATHPSSPRRTQAMTHTNTEDTEDMRLVSKRRKDMAAWAVKNFKTWPKPHEIPDADPEEIGCELVVLNQHHLPVLRCKLGGGYVDSTTWFYAKRNPQK